MQKQTVSFSRTLSCLALVGLLSVSFSANNAVGQIYIDGRQVDSPYTNQEHIGMTFSPENAWSNFLENLGNINTAYFYNGSISNRMGGTIGTANLHNWGAMYNLGTVGTANVSTGQVIHDSRGDVIIASAGLTNYGYDFGDLWLHGTIDTLNVDGNGVVQNGGAIGTANVRDNGHILAGNDSSSAGSPGIIDTANVYDDARVHAGTIGTANVHDNARVRAGSIGTVNVYDNARVHAGLIGTANVYDGMIDNSGFLATSQPLTRQTSMAMERYTTVCTGMESGRT